MKRSFLISFLFFCGAFAFAQNTIVSGTVRDKETKETLPFVSIFFVGTNEGVTSDEEGKYTIKTNHPYTQLQFSFVGYKPVIKALLRGESQVINVSMQMEATILQEVLVTSGKVKERYRNKNNPAVDLIRKVIDNKVKNRIESHDYVDYEQYEKLEFSMSNMVEKLKSKKLYKKYRFFFENVDTTKLEGKSLLPIYLQETISKHYLRKNPESRKEIITAHKKVSFEDYIDNEGLSTYLNHLYQNIDIYDNDIPILTNQFLSPISNSSPLFYKFYLTDTLVNNNVMLYELTFVPRNKSDFLFQGRLYITMDDRYAVQGVDMGVNKNINLNWVRDLQIMLDFDQASDHRYYLRKSTMMADFSLSKSGGGILGERTVSIRDFAINQPIPDSLFEGPPKEILSGEEEQGNDFWIRNRHDSLTVAESKVYENIDSLQKMPSFRRTMDIATLLLAGYKSFGAWELGPVNTFYSFNPVEGLRFRVGGRTTPKFSDHLYFDTYAAYGFKDEKWKYYIGATHSFTGKSPLEFPVRAARISYQKDTKIPGQELQFVQEDNFLLSFKRGVNDKWLYNDIWNVDYLHEFKNHLSIRPGFKYWTQQPAGGLSYKIENENGPAPVPEVVTAEISMELRWAPGEQFYQGKLYRIPIPNKYPIITGRFINGIKGLLHGEYTYQNVSLNFYKRFYLSQFGYTDLVAEGGYVFGKVPYPLLAIHRANQTYSYQLQAYNLMNFLEFVSDQYASIHFDHYFNGFFFNKIPLLKKLKLREVATLKVLYGDIRHENIPTNSNGLILPATTQDGIPATYSLEKGPYIEASVGVANILKFFRIDLVKRFTYLDHPYVSEWGIRSRFKFDF